MKEQTHCSFCGKELVFKTLRDGSSEKYCDTCDHVFFSSPFPSVIVLLTNSNKVLLVKGIGWNVPYWGLIAGHVRVAETAEETGIREVREEVGLEVPTLQFLGTYATKREELMIAFKAETDATSIQKSRELEDAKWFDTTDRLPLRSGSVAAKIVKRVFPEAGFRFTEGEIASGFGQASAENRS